MEPVPARLMRRALAKYITLLGLPPETEIFPKQDTVDWAGGATGSWINAPFYGDERWPIGADGQRLPLTTVPPHWQSAKALKEFVGPEEKPAGKKPKRRRRTKEEDTFNADDAERWLEFHAEKVANAVGDDANNKLNDAIWALGHMHEFLDQDDVEEALRTAWHERNKEDREFDSQFNPVWEKASHHPDPPRCWPEPVIVRNFGNAVPKLIRWLGRGWTAIGQIALWSGDSDVGKTTTLIDYEAKLTRGGTLPFSDERLPAKRVLMAIAEDDEDDTITPRLMRAGANMDLFDQLVGYKKRDGTEGEICLDTEQGRKRIEEALSKHDDYELVVFDPDTAFLSARFNSNDVVAWRSQVMKPMKRLAKKHGVAVLFIAHPRKVKQGEIAQHSVSGSAAQVQASRIHCIFGDEFEMQVDPNGYDKPVRTGNFLMAYSRGANMSREEKRKTKIGRVEGGNLTIEGEQTSIGGIEWIGIREDVTADEVASNRGGVGDCQTDGGKGPSKQYQAKAFLRLLLRDGPVRETKVEEEAGKPGVSISLATLRLAKTALRIKPWKKQRGVEPSEDDGAWFWELPESKPEEPPSFFNEI